MHGAAVPHIRFALTHKGISQLVAQPAGLLPNGAPPGGQTLGLTTEKSNSKYGELHAAAEHL